jgi:glutamyl-tRNA reductase
MSVAVVGMSHRTAPVALLERSAVGPDALPGFTASVAAAPHVAEAVVLSTCNRVEVYADVRAFHAGVGELTAALAESAGLAVDRLTPHLYVHYEDRVVQHLFETSCGLDSMVLGEAQILGQVRDALRVAQDAGSVGRGLHELFQRALRVGKRVHAETGIDRAGSALVSLGLDLAGGALDGLSGRNALVVGAGSMSALAAAHLVRAGVGELVVANRTRAHADRLAASTGGRAAGLDALETELRRADVVVACTGATGFVVRHDVMGRAHAGRDGRPQVLLDLALPRDVDPEVLALPGVTLVDLEELGALLVEQDRAPDLEAVRVIVAEEVAAYLAERQSARVAPTVVALRAMAEEVVVAELGRFDGRAAGLDPAVRGEVERTVRRVVDKLLHAPTVRVKELAAEPQGLAYAEVLHALFDLDPARYRAVAVADLHAVEVEEPRW